MIIDLHKKSIYNKDAVKKADLCGCFHCCEIFSPNEIKDWTDNGQTAVCPKCKTDAIIPLQKDDLDSKELLEKMYGYYFK